MKKNVLVTGGEGYIGSNIVNQLIENDFFVISYDNLYNSSKKENKIRNYKFVEGDIKDFDKLNLVLKENKIDLIIHCAALISVGDSVQQPIEYFEVNSFGSLNLIKAMKENNVKKIIFSSTAATYGIPKDNKLILETDIQSPINPYGESKLMVEKMIKDSEIAYGIKSIIFRYFNVAGADVKNNLFYSSKKPASHIIPIVNDFFLGKRKDFEIFGNDYNTKDGTCVRDYVHVVDLASAHILGAKYLFENDKSNEFNISLGKGYSNLEIFNIANKVHEKNLKPKFGQKRLGDPDFLVASNEKITKELKWVPKYDVEDMIRDDLKK